MTAEFIVAVHALEYLAHKDKCVSSEEIAKNVCTNAARVRKVLSKLEKAGLAGVKNGSCGGYEFSGDTKNLTLDVILSALGEDVVTLKWRSGDVKKECLIASGMAKIMDDVLDKAESGARAALKKITLSDIDGKLFLKNH